MEPEKQAQPPPYSPEQYPAGQYPPPHPQPQPQPQPYPTQQYYPQYPAGPVGVQPAPAPGPYAPASAAQSTTVVVAPPTVIVGAQYGYQPVRINCPHCNNDVVTEIQHEVGGLAWMICGIIVLVGVFIAPCILLGCCFIPFCISDCKDVSHYCPHCKQRLAHVPRMK